MRTVIVQGELEAVSLIEEVPSGSIWKARDLKSDCTLIVKTISLYPRTVDVTAFSKILFPANTQLSPLAPLKFISVEGQRLVISYDILPSQSLLSLIEGRLISFELGKRFAATICAGLHTLHKQGMTHGRLLPETSLISGEDDLKLTEYCLTPLWNEPFPYELPFLDPLSIERRTASSDIYQLGVILYQMATGHLPFDIDEMQKLKERPVKAPPPIGKRASNWPFQAFDIINRALTLDTRQRYENVSEISAAFAAM